MQKQPTAYDTRCRKAFPIATAQGGYYYPALRPFYPSQTESILAIYPETVVTSGERRLHLVEPDFSQFRVWLYPSGLLPFSV